MAVATADNMMDAVYSTLKFSYLDMSRTISRIFSGNAFKGSPVCGICSTSERSIFVSLKILFYQCCDKAVEVPCSGDFPNDDEFTSCKCQGDYFLLRVSETCNLISEYGEIIKKRILDTRFALISRYKTANEYM